MGAERQRRKSRSMARPIYVTPALRSVPAPFPLRDLPLRDPLPLHHFLPRPLHALLRSNRFSARAAHAQRSHALASFSALTLLV